MNPSSAQAQQVDDEAAGALARALGLEALFPDFGARRLGEVFPKSSFSLYPKDFRLVSQGEAGRDIFVIRNGKVSVEENVDGADIPLVVLGPGDIFGEIGLLRGGVRTATAVALEESRIFRLACEDLEGLIAKNPELGNHLGRVATARLERWR